MSRNMLAYVFILSFTVTFSTYTFVCRASAEKGHYKLGRGVFLSVCLSVAFFTVE